MRVIVHEEHHSGSAGLGQQPFPIEIVSPGRDSGPSSPVGGLRANMPAPPDPAGGSRYVVLALTDLVGVAPVSALPLSGLKPVTVKSRQGEQYQRKSIFILEI